MSVHVQRDGHWTVIQIRGDLDAGSVPDVQDVVLDTVTGPGQSYLLDLGEVPHLDSTGLAVLVKFYREVRTRGGRVALCRLQREPRRLFQVTRLDTILPIFTSAEAARTQ